MGAGWIAILCVVCLLLGYLFAALMFISRMEDDKADRMELIYEQSLGKKESGITWE